MSDELDAYRVAAIDALRAIRVTSELEAWYREHLSPSGRLTAWRKTIGKLAAAARPAFGAHVNEIARDLTERFEDQRRRVGANAIAERLKIESVDVTLPPRRRRRG